MDAVKMLNCLLPLARVLTMKTQPECDRKGGPLSDFVSFEFEFCHRVVSFVILISTVGRHIEYKMGGYLSYLW
ncbi:hypothetical protein F5X98DRAFT_251280 [Xylaria grammica]|nr:hypothetical protein F5X98DRAFT_251280 [Xylaria grammica]